MTTPSHKLLKFRAFLNLEAARSALKYGEYLGHSIVEWEGPEYYGSLPHLTLCAESARNSLFLLADRCLAELRSFLYGPAEFFAMERRLIDYAQNLRKGTMEVLQLEVAPRLTRFGMDIGMDYAAEQIFEAHIGELLLWLDKERFDYDVPATVDEVKLTRSGRPPAPWWGALLADIAGQLYLGDLKPENQAQIEKAMLSWAADNGIEVSESAVRPRARKLWIAISKEGKN